MTFNPESLQELGTFWSEQGGDNLGVVGNQKHCGGYHLGRDRIYSTCACRPDGTCEAGAYGNDYSVQLSRDRAGLSNAASAIDLGRLNGSIKALYSFSSWLVQRAQAKAPGTRDIREIIYSPDGRKVQRYSGVDGLIHTGPGNGDLSHLTHTHISFFRDSEFRSKVGLFAPYFELPETSVEEPDDVQFRLLSPAVGRVTVAIDGAMMVTSGGGLVPIPRGQVRESFALGYLLAPLPPAPDDPSTPGDESDRQTVFILGRALSPVTETTNVEAGFLLAYAGAFTPASDPTPYSQAQLDAARAAGISTGRTQIKAEVQALP